MSGFLIPEISEINMAMNKFVLNGTPQKITDGSKGGAAQGMGNRDFYFAQGTSMPSKDVHLLDNKVSFPEGVTLWAWASDLSPVTVVVLTSD